MRTTGAHNSVRMAARLSGGDDWVNTTIDNWFGARQTPESVSGR
jgi:hypothetical protein